MAVLKRIKRNALCEYIFYSLLLIFPLWVHAEASLSFRSITAEFDDVPLSSGNHHGLSIAYDLTKNAEYSHQQLSCRVVHPKSVTSLWKIVSTDKYAIYTLSADGKFSYPTSSYFTLFTAYIEKVVAPTGNYLLREGEDGEKDSLVSCHYEYKDKEREGGMPPVK